MTATVAKLVVTAPKAKKTRAAPRTSRKFQKAMHRQIVTAGFIGFVAVTLTGLSLHHLAVGVEKFTGSTQIESWAMAIGIDLLFIGMELAQLMVSSENLAKKIAPYAKGTIITTLVVSAGMNAFAFASAQSGWMMYASATLGVGIPGLIFLATKVGAALYIDCHSRSN